MRRASVRSGAGLWVLHALGSCAVGPDYKPQPFDVPPVWQPDAPWHAAAPGDALTKGRWWHLFEDPVLDPLLDQALQNNQSLRVAATRLDRARSEVTVAASYLAPSIDLGASGARGKTSANRPLAGYGLTNQSTVQNNFTLGPSVSYEIDLFGRVRREVEGYRAAAEQAAADFENTQLMLTSELVSDYFTLRELDSEIDVVNKSLELEHGALAFITSRHDLGYATGFDLAQQQAQVQSSAAQLELLQVQRAQNEHAIATLVGTPAPGFSIEPRLALPKVPLLPLGVPSDLLQRRPDVASAERAMAAANARVGVARAAYFPSIQILPAVPGFGWQSAAIGALLSAPSQLWSIGVSATQTVFDAGRTRANVHIAQLDYTSAVAAYRQNVLVAMQEVENGITGLTALDRAADAANASVKSAQRAFDIANERYRGGVAVYLDVLTAQQILLSDQRQAVQIQGQEFLTAVYLIKALGGGWQEFR